MALPPGRRTPRYESLDEVMPDVGRLPESGALPAGVTTDRPFEGLVFPDGVALVVDDFTLEEPYAKGVAMVIRRSSGAPSGKIPACRKRAWS